MGDFKANATSVRITGGIAIGNDSVATGAGGNINIYDTTGISRSDIRSITKKIKRDLSGLPNVKRVEIEEIISNIHIESDRKSPDQAYIRKLLLALKNVCEGAVGNLAATGIVELLRRFPL